ncbi:MAG TPA: hypothetical protein VEC60_18265, partial [Reyranella sp.]|nr:hypothetical protein [Reyranella sp.]
MAGRMRETSFIVQSFAELSALRGEWNELLGRCPGYFVSQTFNWSAVAWEYVAQPRGRRLFCVGLREADRLVAFWPMVVYRQGGAEVVRPLGTEGSEYSTPLVEEGADAERRTRQLLAFIAGKADLIFLPFVRGDSELSKAIPGLGLLRAADHGGPAPFIKRSAFDDWETYRRSWTSFLRNKMKRMHARLSRHGTVTMGEEDPRNAREVIGWIIAQKA